MIVSKSQFIEPRAFEVRNLATAIRQARLG